MAILRFPPTDRKIEHESEIRLSLAALGIDFERWELSRVPADARRHLEALEFLFEVEGRLALIGLA